MRSWLRQPVVALILRRLLRISISLDQTLNTIFGGDEDETISSRAGKARHRNQFAYWLCWLLDKIDPNHCEDAIEADEGEPLMNFSLTRILEPDKIVDQLQGLAFGIAMAVIVVVVGEVAVATDAEIISRTFWITMAGTAARSAATAVATILGLTIPGVSSGD
jgi:hypothetical protein